MSERWIVEFNGRAGGQAQAVLGSEEEARAFAERHARAVTSSPAGLPLKWSDTSESLVLTTVLGSYRVVRVADKPGRSF